MGATLVGSDATTEAPARRVGLPRVRRRHMESPGYRPVGFGDVTCPPASRRAVAVAGTVLGTVPGAVPGAVGAPPWHTADVIVVSRFRYPDDDIVRPRAELASCVDQLGRCAGFVSRSGRRALDDPPLWLLPTTSRRVGSDR